MTPTKIKSLLKPHFNEDFNVSISIENKNKSVLMVKPHDRIFFTLDHNTFTFEDEQVNEVITIHNFNEQESSHLFNALNNKHLLTDQDCQFFKEVIKYCSDFFYGKNVYQSVDTFLKGNKKEIKKKSYIVNNKDNDTLSKLNSFPNTLIDCFLCFFIDNKYGPIQTLCLNIYQDSSLYVHCFRVNEKFYFKTKKNYEEIIHGETSPKEIATLLLSNFFDNILETIGTDPSEFDYNYAEDYIKTHAMLTI